MSNDNCNSCIRVINLEEKIKTMEKEFKEMGNKVFELEKSMERYGEKFDKVLYMIEEMKKSLSEISLNLREVQFKPANRWEKLITAIISAGAGAMVAYFIK